MNTIDTKMGRANEKIKNLTSKGEINPYSFIQSFLEIFGVADSRNFAKSAFNSPSMIG